VALLDQAAGFRRDFADFSPTVYLDCAYQGPFPLATIERVHQSCQSKAHPERLTEQDYFDLPESVRAHLARIVGADKREIALTNSATQGIGIAAGGLNLQAGDEVLVASTNFPSNLFTWLHLRRRGVKVTVIRPVDQVLRFEDVATAFSSNTRVLALDWVSYSTGVRIDLAAFGELAHRHGALFVVDGTQGVGALTIKVGELPVDVLVVAAYKWLLGPYGTGFVYLDWRVQDLLELHVVNWATAEGSENFESLPIEELTLPREARIFDVPGTASFLNLHGLEASLAYVERVGAATVTRHCQRLLRRLASGLRDRGFELSAASTLEHESTILAFRAGSLAATTRVHTLLRRRHVAVSLRQGMIRVSPYLYNDEDDIDYLLSVLDETPSVPVSAGLSAQPGEE
jgi:selenocysteine lyase/cysteine desulfurase